MKLVIFASIMFFVALSLLVFATNGLNGENGVYLASIVAAVGLTIWTIIVLMLMTKSE